MVAKTAVGEFHGVVTQDTPEGHTSLVPVDDKGNVSVTGLLQIALTQLGGANPDAVVGAMERLVGLHERMETRAAEKAFNRSLSAFQSECPSFSKGKLVDYTSKRTGARVKYRYGDLHEIHQHIMPCLSKNDLSVAWGMATENGKEYSVCTISHVEGHRRSSKFPIIPDDGNEKSFRSGSQEFGASESYAMRRSMISVLGMTGYDPDLDGESQRASAPPTMITAEQGTEIDTLLRETGTNEKTWLDYFGIASVMELPVSQYQKAVNQLNRKKGA